MSTLSGLDLDRLVSLLVEAFGERTAVERTEQFSPWWAVARIYLANEAAELPKSVIVKWLRHHSQNFRTDPAQMLTERAALEFLAELNLSIAPTLLAANDDSSLLILEDLAPRVVLFDLVRDGHPGGAQGLRAFAEAWGQLHGGTVYQTDAYYRRRAKLGPVDPERDRRYGLGDLWIGMLPDFGSFGVEVPAGVESEMRAARESLIESGPFTCFSNGDAGANNFFVSEDDGRFIDFEFAGYRNALIDAACLHVPGPMWMTVSDPIGKGLVDVYRRGLSAGVRSAEDDKAFASAMAAACLVVAMHRLERLPTLEGRPSGHESRAQMVSTLDSASRAARQYGSFPRFTGWIQAFADVLRKRWPDADREFPDAYTTRE